MDDNHEQSNESSPTLTISEIPDSNLRRLTHKQEKFVQAYIKLNDPVKACIAAGFAVKSASVEANRLLKRANIIDALAHWRKSKREQLSKDDYVDKAMVSFEKLDITEPNSPRFLDIAGKALGYIGANNQPSVTNNTQINIKADVVNLGTDDKWAHLRNLLEG